LQVDITDVVASEGQVMQLQQEQSSLLREILPGGDEGWGTAGEWEGITCSDSLHDRLRAGLLIRTPA
jgi:hypothetical protein